MRERMLGICVAVVVAMVFTGCQQPQEAPSQQQARLLAAQDADLQKQLAARQAEIATLQQKHAKELRQRDLELLQCRARIDALQKDLEKGIDERVKSVTATVMDENAKLRQEVEQLKAQSREAQSAPAKENKCTICPCVSRASRPWRQVQSVHGPSWTRWTHGTNADATLPRRHRPF